MAFLCLWRECDLDEDVCFSGEDIVDDKSVEGVLCSGEDFVWEFVWEIGLEAVEVWGAEKLCDDMDISVCVVELLYDLVATDAYEMFVFCCIRLRDWVYVSK